MCIKSQPSLSFSSKLNCFTQILGELSLQGMVLERKRDFYRWISQNWKRCLSHQFNIRLTLIQCNESRDRRVGPRVSLGQRKWHGIQYTIWKITKSKHDWLRDVSLSLGAAYTLKSSINWMAFRRTLSRSSTPLLGRTVHVVWKREICDRIELQHCLDGLWHCWNAT